MIELNQWLLENKDRKFLWGQWDCAMFVCEWLTNSRGIDYSIKSKNRYKTAIGALKHLQKTFGCATLELAVDSVLGERKHIVFAKAGDIVCAEFSDSEIGRSLGICNGYSSWFLTDEGMIQIPTLECEWSWNG